MSNVFVVIRFQPYDDHESDSQVLGIYLDMEDARVRFNEVIKGTQPVYKNDYYICLIPVGKSLDCINHEGGLSQPWWMPFEIVSETVEGSNGSN